MKTFVSALFAIFICSLKLSAQAPKLPTKESLSETILSSRMFSNAMQLDTVFEQHIIPNEYTLEIVARVNSSIGRGLDIEARNSALNGFRLSLNASNLQWTAPLSESTPWTASPAGQNYTIRIAVKNDSAHIYQNGAYIGSQPLSSIKDIFAGAETSNLYNVTKGPQLIPNWSGTTPNNAGKPSDYGWLLNPANSTLFATANSSTAGTSRYMDVNSASGSNLHTYNGSTYTGRLFYVRWDNSSIANTVYAYPVTLEANTTYSFSMLDSYVSNATGTQSITVGFGTTTAISGRISSKTFTTSGTRSLKKDEFIFTSQAAGTYYLTFTGTWGLYSIGELTVNKIDATPRFIFGKNYPNGAVDMQITSVTYENGAYAPSGITTNAQRDVTVSGSSVYYLPSFDTRFFVGGKTDVHLTGEYSPLVNSTMALNSNDAWLFFDNIKPSQVMAGWLDKVTINGVSAKNNPNVRLAIFKNGTVVIPNGNQRSLHALEVYSGQSLSGDSTSYDINTYHDSLGTFDNNIRSFRLYRGYMATFANNPDGSGFSRVFIANDSDLIINSMPQGLDTLVSFIRVFKWDWVSKKGKAGWNPNDLNCTWYYDWNIGGSSSDNYNYVAIRQNAGWPSWTDINNKAGINHLSGFNEPDQSDQSNMSVDQAVSLWPGFMNSGYRVGSPSPANPESSWITNFLAKTDSLNYRVDYVTIHCYWGAQTPSQWYSRLKAIYNRVRRPLWITEWNNGANWTGESWPSDTSAALQKQLNDIKGILQVLDTASFVERYAEYDWVQYFRSMVLADTLTPAGRYYAANKSSLGYNSKIEAIHTWKLVGPPLTASVNSDDYFRSTLKFVDINGETGSKYALERKIMGRDTSFVPITELTGYTIGDSISFVDSIYEKASYRIKAYNWIGDQFAYGRNLDVTRDALPVAPTSLVGSVLSSSIDSIKWNAGANARSYNLKRSLNADGPFQTIASRTTQLAFEDDSLQPSTTYYYVITSLNSAGESSNSTVLRLTTKDLVAPTSVLGPHIASGDAKAILTWDFQYDAKYDISRSETQNGSYEVIATDVDSTRYEDSNRINDKSYFYKVVAQNTAGSSPSTQVLTATPREGHHAYINFDEEEGAFAEDKWGGYHGKLGSAVPHVIGKANGAVQLDGTTTSYISLATGAVSALNDFTIATWIKIDVLSNWMRIFDFGTGTSQYMFLTPQSSSSGGKSNIRFGIKNGNVEQQVNYSYAWPLNAWTHLAITRSGTTVNLYVNGELVATNTNVTILPSDLGYTTKNYIGKSQYNDPLLKGSIDEFRIYNKALSDSEVKDAMKLEQFISFDSIPSKQLDDPDFDGNAFSSSGLTVNYSSSNAAVAAIVNGMIHITGPGETQITAWQRGDSVYAAAKPVVQTLIVYKMYFLDADGDGFGSQQGKLFSTAVKPGGYSDNSSDCDDSKFTYGDNDGDGLGAGAPVPCGVTNNNDCDDTNPIPVTVFIPDVYALNPAVDEKNTIYLGYGPSSLNIQALPAGGRAPYSYKWNTGATTQSISIGAAGSYIVTVTDSKGCTASTTVIINVQDVRCGNNNDKVIVCHNGNAICVALTSVQAHLDHGDKLGLCTSLLTFRSGELDNNILNTDELPKVTLYPNPVKENLNVEMPAFTGDVTFQLYDANGKLVISKKLTSFNSHVSLKGIAAGVYYIQIKNASKTTTGKIIKQ